jgi:hypothetical protein
MSTQYTTRILNRVRDTDVSLSDFPGGIMDKYAQQLSDDELVELVSRLDDLAQEEPERQLHQRYDATIAFLQKVAQRRVVVASEREIQDLAAEARLTGKKTCRCEANHVEGSNHAYPVHTHHNPDRGRRLKNVYFN